MILILLSGYCINILINALIADDIYHHFVSSAWTHLLPSFAICIVLFFLPRIQFFSFFSAMCCDSMSIVQIAFVNPLINELCMYVCMYVLRAVNSSCTNPTRVHRSYDHEFTRSMERSIRSGNCSRDACVPKYLRRSVAKGSTQDHVSTPVLKAHAKALSALALLQHFISSSVTDRVPRDRSISIFAVSRRRNDDGICFVPPAGGYVVAGETKGGNCRGGIRLVPGAA